MRKQELSVEKMLYTCIFMSALTVLIKAENCVKMDSCTCKTSTREYSLHSLSSPNGARFDARYNDDHYYYNPCKDFSKHGSAGSQQVTGVFMPTGQIPITQHDNVYSKKKLPCKEPGSNFGWNNLPFGIIQYQGNVYYSLADDSTAEFTGDPDHGNLQLKYTHKDSASKTRISIVSIQCVPGVNDFTFVKEQPELTYYFTLRTDIWCPATDTGLSVGSILVILFFVFLIVYIVAGILFLKFVRRAEGVELVPNYEFWKALPPLIRDGCFFTFRGCKAESTYEKI